MVNSRFVMFLVYLFFGLYFLNKGLIFFVIPEFISNLESWIILIAGALLVVASFNYLKKSKKKSI